MPVEFSCDGCTRRLRAPDAKAGKRTNCPTCGKELQIPVMSASPQMSLPTAGAPAPNPLDKLAAAIPIATDPGAAFNLSKPGARQPATPFIPTVSVIPTTPAPKTDLPQPIEIGLADEAPQKPASAAGSSLSNSGSNSSSAIGGSLKPKPNAWRGGEKTPATPLARPAMPQSGVPAINPAMPQTVPTKPTMPNLAIPGAGTPRPVMPAPQMPLQLPMASAAASPLVPVAPVAPTAPTAPNPLDDIFKDIPQLAPVSAQAQPYSNNAPMFGGLKPVTAADPFQSQGAALPTAAAPNWSQIASTASVGSSNTYAAPSMGASAGYRRNANIESVRTIVMIPGVFLLITYILWMIYAIGNLAVNAAQAATIFANESDNAERTGFAIGLIFGSLLLFVLAIAGLFGAIKMIRLRSWGSALTASIMAIFPFCLCLPLGIWCVIVLSMENVRLAFEANDRRAERGA